MDKGTKIKIRDILILSIFIVLTTFFLFRLFSSVENVLLSPLQSDAIQKGVYPFTLFLFASFVVSIIIIGVLYYFIKYFEN